MISAKELYHTTSNEPKVHPLVRKSFIFVPTAGMRLAPEILILELFREVFFEKHHGEDPKGTKEIDPNERGPDKSLIYNLNERAVYNSLRGRRKKSRGAKPKSFFAPAYPSLAERGWLGKNRERVINNFLLGGPVAQHLWHRSGIVDNPEQKEFIDRILNALIGHNACSDDRNIRGKEILSVAIRQMDFQVDFDLAKKKLKEKTESSDLVFTTEHDDELAKRIYLDLLRTCELETNVPRIQWMQVLMTFLRFALPVWLLAQMKITSFVHKWMIEAVDESRIASAVEIRETIEGRNRDSLHPTLTPTRELFEHVERYMKYRVEVNILLHCLGQIKPHTLKDKKLVLNGSGSDKITLQALLTILRDVAGELRSCERFVHVANGLSVRQFLAREGEQFAAWRTPLLKGQGKNIDEFFRVLYRAETGDEAGGYLLYPEGRGLQRGFRVFPGQLLLKTITYFAAQDKRAVNGGKLVLEDVEEHFQQYGINFSNAADARPILMQSLRAMGLLAGSPDAGSSVSVRNPY